MKLLDVNLDPYIRLMRLDRPIGSLLLLWPTLSALFIAAKGMPNPLVLAVFVLGVFVMRSAGCVINDYADRNIDGKIARTQHRPLATGELSLKDALFVFVILVLIAFALVTLLNSTTILLSLGALFLAAIYPFMKRFTYYPQIVLGMAFGWAIPMAFAAQTGEVSKAAWLLFLVNIVWTTMYDTFYAMADREDDLKADVKSTAIIFGEDDLSIQMILQLTVIATLVLLGVDLEMSAVYYASLVIIAGLFVYQLQLAKQRDPQQCFKAFLNNNLVGLTLFLGIALHYLYAPH